MAWPLLLKIGLGAGAAWWATSCSWRDGLAKYKRNKDAYTNLDKAGGNAMLAGKLPANHTLVTRIETFKTEFQKLGVMVEAMDSINPLGVPNMSACALVQRCEEDSKQLVSLAAEFAAVTGLANPIPSAPVPSEWSLQDTIKYGVYIVGGYYLLKSFGVLKGLASSQPSAATANWFGGDDIPRDQLPRYAGGRRKLSKRARRS